MVSSLSKNDKSLKTRVLKFVLYTAIVLYIFTIFYPIFLMIITSLKSRSEVPVNPFGLPRELYLDNYKKLFSISKYLLYFWNSILVTVISLTLVIVLSSMVAFVLAKYNFPARKFLYVYFILGLIIPFRLGSLSILKMMIDIKVYDTIFSLIIINTAIGIPFGVFVLTDFIRVIPDELCNAARIDGYSEPHLFLSIILPLAKPAIATVAIVYFIPFWNDFWFPLILTESDSSRTVPRATALLFGQFETDYGLVFAVLSLASIPVILFYLILSKQFVKGLSAGALKG